MAVRELSNPGPRSVTENENFPPVMAQRTTITESCCPQAPWTTALVTASPAASRMASATSAGTSQRSRSRWSRARTVGTESLRHGSSRCAVGRPSRPLVASSTPTEYNERRQSVQPGGYPGHLALALGAAFEQVTAGAPGPGAGQVGPVGPEGGGGAEHVVEALAQHLGRAFGDHLGAGDHVVEHHPGHRPAQAALDQGGVDGQGLVRVGRLLGGRPPAGLVVDHHQATAAGGVGVEPVEAPLEHDVAPGGLQAQLGGVGDDAGVGPAVPGPQGLGPPLPLALLLLPAAGGVADPQALEQLQQHAQAAAADREAVELAQGGVHAGPEGLLGAGPRHAPEPVHVQEPVQARAEPVALEGRRAQERHPFQVDAWQALLFCAIHPPRLRPACHTRLSFQVRDRQGEGWGRSWRARGGSGPAWAQASSRPPTPCSEWPCRPRRRAAPRDPAPTSSPGAAGRRPHPAPGGAAGPARGDRLRGRGRERRRGDAVALARQLEPDIVVIDLRMPVLNGLNATRLIKDGRSATQVVVLSAFESPELERQAREAGAFAYWTRGRWLGGSTGSCWARPCRPCWPPTSPPRAGRPGPASRGPGRPPRSWRRS